MTGCNDKEWYKILEDKRKKNNLGVGKKTQENTMFLTWHYFQINHVPIIELSQKKKKRKKGICKE